VAERALVFAGGDFSKDTMAAVASRIDCDVWCADRGVVHAVAAGLMPTIIVGDCDSLSEADLAQAMAGGAELIRLEREKNASDLEYTLRELVARDYAHVTVLGVSGGRADHHLFNWLLALQQDWPFSVTFIDSTVSAYLVHQDAPFNAQIPFDTTVSLIGRESVSGVTTTGLKYPLTDARLMGGSTLGLSNEVARDADEDFTSVSVTVTTGRLLVCVVNT
jgi:thiamine pyrophosphokinase